MIKWIGDYFESEQYKQVCYTVFTIYLFIYVLRVSGDNWITRFVISAGLAYLFNTMREKIKYIPFWVLVIMAYLMLKMSFGIYNLPVVVFFLIGPCVMSYRVLISDLHKSINKIPSR